MKGTSAEIQDIALKALINDPYILSKCMGEITESYFANLSYKLAYKCLKKYYTKYMVIPTAEDMMALLEDDYSPEYGEMDTIKTEIKTIYARGVSSEDFLYEKLIEFIRRNKIELCLSKVVRHMENQAIDLDEVATDLRDGVSLTLTKTEAYNLADVSKIDNIKTDAFGSSDSPVAIRFFIDSVNAYFQYKALIPGTLNMITAAPGRGKSTLMINQGVSTAQQGYRVLHIFLGDMSKYDGLLRYLSCISGVATSKLVDMSTADLSKFVQKYNMTGVLSLVDVLTYAAGELTVGQLIEEITMLQKEQHKHYHMIIIDYDENLTEEDSENMYKSGGQVYNKLALFATLNKSVVWVVSQPKPEFWSKEIITLEAAAESSKKQKIIDLMMSMGKTSKDSAVATLYLAKNRRGEDCKIFRLKVDGATARIIHITEEEYATAKQTERHAKE